MRGPSQGKPFCSISAAHPFLAPVNMPVFIAADDGLSQGQASLSWALQDCVGTRDRSHCQELFLSGLYLAVWQPVSPLFGSLPRVAYFESKATLPLSFFFVEIQ